MRRLFLLTFSGIVISVFLFKKYHVPPGFSLKTITMEFPGLSADSVLRLPSKVEETSALIFFDDAFWTINDSGDDPVLYRLNKDFKKLHSYYIKGAVNSDWEALGQDQSFIYIGDLGNNLGYKSLFHIWLIEKKELLKATDTISFYNQISFSYICHDTSLAIPYYHEYDCEAMLVANDSIWLITKNWKDKRSFLYGFPSIPGYYELQNPDTLKMKGLTTDANWAFEDSLVILTGYMDYLSFITIFEHISNPRELVTSKYRQNWFLDMEKYQTEGVTIGPDSRIYLSNERSDFRESVVILTIDSL